ncbi:hypothetical protein P3T36_000191 [Kitasatospora sp. MAP12-15]|uniref:DUF6296 family protein n=1 Tax=unclassified Kitasatospora TaxID=2633591 RepID=UPI00247663A3|nr:DUF6296 family protein [Kitasatospora sp. MAP12-44]MDH6109420.1 hypothetical protein [Kitasatospora sp. MAP12-44]
MDGEYCYALTFPATPGDRTPPDVVIMRPTSAKGPGGHPVYADGTGIIRAEINEHGDVRMLASGGQQSPNAPVRARRLSWPELTDMTEAEGS